MKTQLSLRLLLFAVFYLIINKAQSQESYGFPNVDASYSGTSQSSKLQDDNQNVALNYNTGVGNINIPIYNIACGQLNLPITVNYQTSGIKADQPSSDVGLGWNLSAGGNISRVIKGLPDEKFYLRTDASLGTYLATMRSNAFGFYFDKSYYSASYSNYKNTCKATGKANECNDYGNDYDMLGNPIVSVNYYLHFDLQPDLFTLNIPGKSLHFVFDLNHNPVFLDNSHDIQLSFDFNSFIVTDEQGIKYYFNASDAETITSDKSAWDQNIHLTGKNYINFDDGGLISADCGPVGNDDGFGIHNIKDNWKLSKIETPDGKNSINFEYENYAAEYMASANILYNVNPSTNTTVAPFTLYPLTGQSRTIGNFYNFILIEKASKRVKKIVWKTGTVNDGTVVFENNTQRTDVESLSFDKSLDYIKIYDGATTELKRFAFNYSYFTSGVTTSVSHEQWRNKRLKLNSITEYGSDLSAKPAYQFEYDATALPIKYSYEQDFWGYYNGNNAGTMQGTLYHNPNYSNTTTSDFALWSPFSIYPFNLPGSGGTSAYSTISGANRLPDITYTKAGILKKITYPTKGTLEMEYESNTFCVDYDLTNRLAGGLRIKKISNNDGLGNLIVKNISYTVAGSMLSGNVPKSSGKINFLPSMGYYTKYFNNGAPLNLHKISSYNMASSATSGESQVVYDEVKIEETGNGYTVYKYNNFGTFGYNNDLSFGGSPMIKKLKSETATWVNNGTLFTDGETMYRNTNHPYSPEPNIEWATGELKEIAVYNQSSQLKYKKVFHYTVKSFGKVHGFVTLPYALLDNYTASTSSSKFNYLSVWKVLDNDVEYRYNPSNPSIVTTKTTNYEYSSLNHKFLTAISSTDSKGETVRTENTYVADCSIPSTASAQDNATLAIRKMKHQTRQLNSVIENTVYRIKGGDKYLIGGSINLYRDFNNTLTNVPNSSGFTMVETNNPPVIRLGEAYTIESASPVLVNSSNYTPFSLQYNSNGLCYYRLIDGNYDRKTAVEGIDAGGNPIQQKVDPGFTNSTIYGYNYTLPIASVTNAGFTDCGFTSFESDDASLWTMLSGVSISNSDGHCGKSSCVISPNTQGPARIYMPSSDAQGKKFILSCWIKTNTAAMGTVGSLVLHTVQNSSSSVVYPGVSSANVSIPLFNTNNSWKYVEVEIDLAKVKSDAGLSSGTALGINSYLNNTQGSIIIQVDDIRFYPKDARMSTYTHRPLVGTTSLSDENSNCRFNEYDTFGRIKLVKDQNGRILEKTDYNYKP